MIGDVQWPPGYSVVITDIPGVERLSDLPKRERAAFLASVDILAEAVEIACSHLDPDFLRVNIEILGNTDTFLHAHIWPRYQWEEPGLRVKPVWLYPGTNWTDPVMAPNLSHDPLRLAISTQIHRLSSQLRIGLGNRMVICQNRWWILSDNCITFSRRF
ncbi:diadenosine tetraphosphate (Ap4A) HIT family hydrolase [Arthrobacter silviterrae]|nr:diadenosine tetraphosphate (Ap4A) HIT family hydrolase [Arthrobacter silviterrae]